MLATEVRRPCARPASTSSRVTELTTSGAGEDFFDYASVDINPEQAHTVTDGQGSWPLTCAPCLLAQVQAIWITAPYAACRVDYKARRREAVAT